MNLFAPPVYVDEMRACVPNRRWQWDQNCHLFVAPTTDVEVLHDFAVDVLGLERGWFQPNGTIPHYDLTKSKRRTAIRKGAVALDWDGLKEQLKVWRVFKDERRAKE